MTPVLILRLLNRLFRIRARSAFLAFVCASPVIAQSNHTYSGNRPHTQWHSKPEVVRIATTLQQGGNVVFFRHGTTDMLATDQYPLADMADCSKQRNLSPSGVAASKEMGEAIRQLGIPIGDILASPYCRSMDTARYAFGRATASPDLYVRRTEEGWALDEAGEQLKKLVAMLPAPGTNTVLVGHVFNVQKTFGLSPTEGEAIVFRPDGRGGYRVVGQLTATQWGDLVRDLVVLKLDPKQLGDESPLPYDQSPAHRRR
jgi:phosphohistidine phosphatase SixA